MLNIATEPAPSGGLRYGPVPTAEDVARVADVVIVGSGASGSVAAWALSREGLDVVVVEAGPFVDPGVSYDDVESAAELAWIRNDTGFWGKDGNPWTTCNVGGGTVFYGGVALRHRPVDFDAGTRLGRTRLPLKWPWSFEELEPYYDAVETLVGVSGADGDPSLPRRVPYPLPPVPTSPEGAAIMAAARSLGLHPFATPLAIASQAYRGRPACDGDRPCISNTCDTGAKGDAARVFLDPARKAGARLFAGLKAVRLVRGAGDSVSAVECVRVDTGERFTLRGRQFVIAGNAVQSAALLLRSTDERSPDGLGNEHDMVGRALCFKMSGYLTGFRKGVEGLLQPAELPQGPGPFSTAAITDFYVDDDAPGGLGGLIYESRPEESLWLRPDEQIIQLECLVPDEPRLDNRVTLGRGTDRFGLPDVVMDYSQHPRDLARLEYLHRRAEEILRAAGCDIVRRESSYFWMGSTHLHGTCRAGEDPRTSVTDPDGRVHTLDNVIVVDGALFPFPGAVNPTLTIQALALRNTHRLLDRGFGIVPEPPTS